MGLQCSGIKTSLTSPSWCRWLLRYTALVSMALATSAWKHALIVRKIRKFVVFRISYSKHPHRLNMHLRTLANCNLHNGAGSWPWPFVASVGLSQALGRIVGGRNVSTGRPRTQDWPAGLANGRSHQTRHQLNTGTTAQRLCTCSRCRFQSHMSFVTSTTCCVGELYLPCGDAHVGGIHKRVSGLFANRNSLEKEYCEMGCCNQPLKGDHGCSYSKIESCWWLHNIYKTLVNCWQDRFWYQCLFNKIEGNIWVLHQSQKKLDAKQIANVILASTIDKMWVSATDKLFALCKYNFARKEIDYNNSPICMKISSIFSQVLARVPNT